MPSHLTYEDPHQPETEGDQDHEAVPDEMEEAVASLLNHIDDRHLSSFSVDKNRVSEESVAVDGQLTLR